MIEKNNTANFDLLELSDEILIEILNNLSAKDLGRFAKTCKKASRLVQDKKFKANIIKYMLGKCLPDKVIEEIIQEAKMTITVDEARENLYLKIKGKSIFRYNDFDANIKEEMKALESKREAVLGLEKEIAISDKLRCENLQILRYFPYILCGLSSLLLTFGVVGYMVSSSEGKYWNLNALIFILTALVTGSFFSCIVCLCHTRPIQEKALVDARAGVVETSKHLFLFKPEKSDIENQISEKEEVEKETKPLNAENYKSYFSING
jgi:hypothetical protein